MTRGTQPRYEWAIVVLILTLAIMGVVIAVLFRTGRGTRRESGGAVGWIGLFGGTEDGGHHGHHGHGGDGGWGGNGGGDGGGGGNGGG